jgi:phosphatidate cytidylyltransferase
MNRFIPGLLMAVLWVLLLYVAPPTLFSLVMIVGAVIALHEVFRMANTSPDSKVQAVGITLCLIPILAAAVFGSPVALLGGAFLSLLGLALLIIFVYSRFSDPLAFLINSGFAVLYIALSCGFIILLRGLPQGHAWLVLLAAITAGSDTGAYYTGRAWGRRKLCPSISPGKTVNGALGGILVAVLVAVLLGWFLLPNTSSLALLLAAVVLAVVGIVGDLTESIIKRGTGCKDSGTLLGGHGGLLDRADSLLFTAPLLYLFLYLGVLS